MPTVSALASARLERLALVAKRLVEDAIVANIVVEVALANVVLPSTVNEEFALTAPPTLSTVLMVVEPVTASAEVVAADAVNPPLNAKIGRAHV